MKNSHKYKTKKTKKIKKKKENIINISMGPFPVK